MCTRNPDHVLSLSEVLTYDYTHEAGFIWITTTKHDFPTIRLTTYEVRCLNDVGWIRW